MITPISPAYTIGKAENSTSPKERLPGPSDYDPYHGDKVGVPSYSFTKSPRQMFQASENPGPGLYSPDLLSKRKGFTIGKSPRALSNIRYRSPGPGDYSWEVNQARYNYSISKARTRSLHSDSIPGPGHYSPNLTASIGHSPIVKFPKQQRMMHDSFLTPAPGYYQLPNVQRSPGFSFPKAVPKFRFVESPGPGFYKTPSSTIGLASSRLH
jgi:hypothetical protein